MDREKKENAENTPRILVAGGRLQGMEIAYLAKKAGYYVILVDQHTDVPAAGIADLFVRADLFDEQQAMEAVRKADYVIPAIEDIDVLQRLGGYCAGTGASYVFDSEAYSLSCSKNKTNMLLKSQGVSIPAEFPGCGYPVIYKPDAASGSKGVIKLETQEEFNRLAKDRAMGCHRDCLKNGYVAQQYLSGPSYSLEVLGNGHEAVFPMITEVMTDEGYDCKRIVAPAKLGAQQEEEFLGIAKKINSIIKIKGIFDIEVILNGSRLYVLEIDARFPSQTPISIYHASGMNFVEILISLAGGKKVSEILKHYDTDQKKTCIYQQIAVEGHTVKVCGEHIMSHAGKLRIVPGFCGADEMLTNYSPGSERWQAIVILTGGDSEETEAKWEACIREIAVIQGCEQMRYIEG